MDSVFWSRKTLLFNTHTSYSLLIWVKSYQHYYQSPQFFLFFLFLFLFCFLGMHLWHVEIPRWGVKLEFQLPAYATAKKHGIWVKSVTYTTAHGNTGSLTHWTRPGIESTSSWIQAGFLTCSATMGTPIISILKFIKQSTTH